VNTPTKTTAVNYFVTCRACQGDGDCPQFEDSDRHPSGLVMAVIAVTSLILSVALWPLLVLAVLIVFTVSCFRRCDFSGLQIGGE
jgi:hypothetical protein